MPVKAFRLRAWERRDSLVDFLPHPGRVQSHPMYQEIRVLGFTGFRVLALVVVLGTATTLVRAADGGMVSAAPSSPSYILVGFVGGFVRHTNPHHGPVQLAQRIQQNAPKGAYIEVFENRRRRAAYHTILRLLDVNRDGALSPEEKAAAHIMLVGQSWGASATVLLARELGRIGIPVMLTVQVDSVAKLWQNDQVIPGNVTDAVNFYQPHGIIHGTKVIRAADDSKTRILGNYRIDYRQTPAHCQSYSWFDRTFTPSHMQSECDPRLWSQVENLIRERMNPEPQRLAINPGP